MISESLAKSMKLEELVQALADETRDPVVKVLCDRILFDADQAVSMRSRFEDLEAWVNSMPRLE